MYVNMKTSFQSKLFDKEHPSNRIGTQGAFIIAESKPRQRRDDPVLRWIEQMERARRVPALREGETASADLPAVGTFHP